MVRRLAVASALLANSAIALAQQSAAPVPLYPNAAPPPYQSEPLPPVAPAPQEVPAPGLAPPSGVAPPMSPPAARVFCDQSVTVRLADPDAIPEPYRPFVGVWSDASWTPALCAALIVGSVTPDGTASIVYVFGPMGSNTRGAGGVLNGTGVVRDGELRFQNSDGSQFAFRPLYADMQGHLTTSKGQTYDAIFKKTP